MTVPHVTEECIDVLDAAGIKELPSMVLAVERKPEALTQILHPIIEDRPTEQALEVSLAATECLSALTLICRCVVGCPW